MVIFSRCALSPTRPARLPGGIAGTGGAGGFDGSFGRQRTRIHANRPLLLYHQRKVMGP